MSDKLNDCEIRMNKKCPKFTKSKRDSWVNQGAGDGLNPCGIASVSRKSPPVYDSPRNVGGPAFSRIPDRKPKSEWVLPGVFDGQSVPWNAFESHFLTCAAHNGWDDCEKLVHLRNCLYGDAEHVLWSDVGKTGSFDG